MKRTVVSVLALLLFIVISLGGLFDLVGTPLGSVRVCSAKVRVPKPPQVAAAPKNTTPEDKAPLVEKMAPTDKIASSDLAVFEYRSDAKALSDLSERLTQALSQNTSLRVVHLTEARRRLGPQIDAEVARCDGETRCLSQVGQRLGVKELLLIAVSQLGDVVLALQRIDVTEQRVLGRYADSLVPGQNIEEARMLSWLQQLFPPDIFKRYGQIQVAANVEGAQIYVNSKASGTTPLGTPLQVLAPGNYRILVEKTKFLPFQAAVTVMPDTTVEVSASLLREQKITPWYRRWYLWTGIVFGVAAVSATAVAVKLATDVPPPDTTQVPGTIVFR